MSDLYTKYLQEKEGKQTLEIKDKGFVTYKIVGDVCHVCILFVDRNNRRGDVARDLMNTLKFMVNKTCKAFTAVVNTRQYDTSATLKIILQYGFEVVDAKDGDIFLYKDF